MGVTVKEKGHVTSKRELLMLGGRKERVMDLLQNAPLCFGPGNERKKRRGERENKPSGALKCGCSQMRLCSAED